MRIVDIGVCKIGVLNKNETPDYSSDVCAALIADCMLKDINIGASVKPLNDFTSYYVNLSKYCGYPLLCGCNALTDKVRHVSAITFYNGRLADVAEKTHSFNQTDYKDDSLKILRLKSVNLGLTVDTDVLIPLNWKKLAPCCDAMVCLALNCTCADKAYIPTLSSIFCKPYAVAFSDGGIMWGTPQNEN